MHDFGVFLLGALAMGDCVAGLFFFRYWLVAQDRFFLYFAASFAIQMVCRMLLIATTANSEAEPLVYVFRLLSYMVILAGIFEKNRVKITKALSGRS